MTSFRPIHGNSFAQTVPVAGIINSNDLNQFSNCDVVHVGNVSNTATAPTLSAAFGATHLLPTTGGDYVALRISCPSNVHGYAKVDDSILYAVKRSVN